jgi:hypothetical protein
MNSIRQLFVCKAAGIHPLETTELWLKFEYCTYCIWLNSLVSGINPMLLISGIFSWCNEAAGWQPDLRLCLVGEVRYHLPTLAPRVVTELGTIGDVWTLWIAPILSPIVAMNFSVHCTYLYAGIKIAGQWGRESRISRQTYISRPGLSM